MSEQYSRGSSIAVFLMVPLLLLLSRGTVFLLHSKTLI